MDPLVLASQSPRRKVLLRYLVEDFEVHAVQTEEVAPRGLSVGEAVQVIARRKALAASRERPERWVLAADTVVDLGDRLVGKARDEATLRQTLATLTGSTHRVTTGLALVYDGRPVDSAHAVTAVHMDRLPLAVLNAYAASGQWTGKAGGYGIQDPMLGPFLHIKSGPWSNVVGLPLALAADLLRRNSVPCREPPAEEAVREENLAAGT